MRREPVRRAFRLDLLGAFAEGQRLRLGEDIGKQYVLMPAEGIEGPAKRDEIAGYEPGPLMDQLIEGMLAVGPWLAPVDRSGVVIHVDAVPGHMLAVALHGELLKIGRETLQVLL